MAQLKTWPTYWMITVFVLNFWFFVNPDFQNSKNLEFRVSFISTTELYFCYGICYFTSLFIYEFLVWWTYFFLRMPVMFHLTSINILYFAAISLGRHICFSHNYFSFDSHISSSQNKYEKVFCFFVWRVVLLVRLWLKGILLKTILWATQIHLQIHVILQAKGKY